MFANALIIITIMIIITTAIIIFFEGRLKLILITDFVSVVRLWDLTSDFHRGAKFEIGVLYTEFVGISMI
jgi:hypothetical protein